MYISYSGYNTLGTCRRAYYLGYVAKVRPERRENRVNMLYGEVVGKVFERFYADEVWRANTTAKLLSLVVPTAERVIAKETRKGGVFDWKDESLKEGSRSLKEVLSEVVETVPRGLGSIRHHGLLGLDAKAEVSLDVDVGAHRIGGRADFVMTRSKIKDLVLFDGKGSKYLDTYTDHTQLRWYSMLYEMKFGVIPDKVGFLYWRSEPAKSLDWSSVTREQLGDLRRAALAAIQDVEDSIKKISAGANPFQLFYPKPSASCRLCKFQHQCNEGQKALSVEGKARRLEVLRGGVEAGDLGL